MVKQAAMDALLLELLGLDLYHNHVLLWQGFAQHFSAAGIDGQVADGPNPPLGTPCAMDRGGNSTPTAAPVSGVLKSPVISPVSGE